MAQSNKPKTTQKPAVKIKSDKILKAGADASKWLKNSMKGKK